MFYLISYLFVVEADELKVAIFVGGRTEGTMGLLFPAWAENQDEHVQTGQN